VLKKDNTWHNQKGIDFCGKKWTSLNLWRQAAHSLHKTYGAQILHGHLLRTSVWYSHMASFSLRLDWTALLSKTGQTSSPLACPIQRLFQLQVWTPPPPLVLLRGNLPSPLGCLSLQVWGDHGAPGPALLLLLRRLLLVLHKKEQMWICRERDQGPWLYYTIV